MSRKKPYQNRLEELFSSTEPVPPEPVKAAPPAAKPADAGLRSSGALSEQTDRAEASVQAVSRGVAGAQPANGGVQVTYTDAPGALDRELSRVLEIGQALAQEQDLASMLANGARLVGERFGLHSVQVFLIEPPMDRLVLFAAAGPDGKELLQQGYSLAIDPHSPAGLAFTTGQPALVADPHLVEWSRPEAQSPAGEEYGVTPIGPVRMASAAHPCATLALPLLAGARSPAGQRGRAFGVLVLHSAQPEAFSAHSRLIFELLASRLAAAIEHLRLYAEAAPRQAESQAGMGWDEFLDAINRKENIGYRYDLTPASAMVSGLEPASEETVEELLVPLQWSGTQADSDPVLTTPLKVGSETIGTLQIDRGRDGNRDGGRDGSSGGIRGAKSNPQVWASGEVELVKSVADRIAQHLENLRLLAQAERYRAEAEEAARRLTREGWETYLEAPQAPLSGYIYDQDQVKPLKDAAQSAGQELAVQPQATGSIKVRDELIGEVAVVDAQQQDELAAGILAVVTERLGSHIENLRLLEETERGRQQLDKRAAELETVARVSTAAATILSPQELLQSVVDLTKYSFNLYHTHVYLLDDDKSALVLKAGAGKVGHRMVSEGETIPLAESNSVAARAAKARAAVVVDDVRQDADFLSHTQLPDARSEMAVPMIVGEQLVGVFDVLANVTGRFSEDDMRTYNTLASQVAVALRNAELYAEQMATVVRLRELDHLKSSFLANMSHELRTPLNSILGFAQVILEGLDGPLTADMSNDLSLIDKNGKHLLYLINEILDMAKIEAGRLSLSPEPVNLRALLEDVLETSASLVRDKSLTMRLESVDQADVTLLMDYTRMRQVFINLVGNAAKFTEKGGVTVDFEKQANKVAIHFRDTGIGIPPNKLDMIFEQFSQVDTSTTRKAGGTGLGLPISRRLVELHGGRLWANSSGVAGEGSVFTVELPIAPVMKG